jgi:POT family proton-dependent oligopeptide transporter
MASAASEATRTADPAAFVARSARDFRFLGHPLGLGILVVSESWERFSYAGMQALLVLYTTHVLFQPEHIGAIWGMDGFRRALEAAYGPLTPQGLASVMFGIYAGMVYLTPILGGLLADRWIGRTRTVVIGAVMLTIGHGLMGFPSAFLLALACIVFGVGCFKTNITAQVGDLYAIDDPRRARGFQLFVMGIATAALLAYLVCGTLGERVSWAAGFGVAGIGMMVGLFCYLSGRRWLAPEERPVRNRDGVTRRPKLAPGEGRVILVLVLLLPVLALANLGNEQIFNAYLLWSEKSYRLAVFGRTIPVTWLLSITSVWAIVAMAGSLAFWRWYALRRPEPDEITKLTIGTAITMLAPLLLSLLSLWTTEGRRIGLGWAVLFHGLNEIGIANLYPVSLALYSRCAPKALGSTIIAVFYLNLFGSNMLVGRLGGLLETMSGSAFWLLHAALIGAALLVLLVVRRVAGRLLAPTSDPEREAVP